MRKETVVTLLSAARSLTATMRAILGAPNYERYLAHMRLKHPLETPMPFGEFEQRRLDDKYLRPGAKCC